MEELEPKTEAKAEPAIKTDSRPLYLQLALPVSILVAGVLISGALIYGRTRAPSGDPVQPSVVSLKVTDQDHVLGSKDAKVTIFEFSDFQCPFCRRFWSESFTQLKANYIDTGKVRFIYRHFPLTSIHQSAQIAAEAAECASEQNQFWQFHDKIFQEQAKSGQGTVRFSGDDVKKWAAQLGLNSQTFNVCFDSKKYSQRVSQDLDIGSKSNVDGTPTFFINGQRVVGAQPYASLKLVIDGFLK